MLLDTYNKDDIVGLVMNTGQEVLGKFDHDSGDHIWLLKPYKIIMTQNGPGMIPYSLLIDYDTAAGEKAVPIKHAAYASCFPVVGNALQDYIQSTTTVALVQNETTIIR